MFKLKPEWREASMILEEVCQRYNNTISTSISFPGREKREMEENWI